MSKNKTLINKQDIIIIGLNFIREMNDTKEQQVVQQCPYIGTIKRHLIDFDLEQICSTTLSNNNVYACLVCGRYFQGKGMNTPAYEHSIEFNHHIFISLNTSKIYCLPDSYEV